MKSPVRLHRRPAAPPRPRHRHDRVGVARQHGGAAALLSAERRRLGRLALARHRDVARPLVDRAYVLQPYALDPGKAAQPYDATALVDGALAFWNHPALTDSTHAALLTFAKNALSDAAQRVVEAQAVLRDDAERAPPADRCQPRPPDGMSELQPLRRPLPLAVAAPRSRARPGAGCRRSSRACRCPPERASPAARS